MFNFSSCKVLFASAAIATFASCNSSSTSGSYLSDSENVSLEEYHADNDIAMIVQSMADALKMGEPLDTLDYNFEGVLTDGEGRPLYTDIKGSPGIWNIDVLSPSYAVIRNIFLGDLLPEDLESYLAGTLNLSPDNLIKSELSSEEEDTQLVIYDLDGCYLRIETRAAVAPNGLEGPFMNIITTTDLPG